jgi:site-specific recombinase XerD
MKRIYDLNDEEKVVVPAVVPEGDFDKFDAMMAKTRTYWQTRGDKSRRKMLSDGTMRNTLECMRSLRNKLGSIVFTDDWVSQAADRLKKEGHPDGSINNYMSAINRFFEANGHREISTPYYEVAHVDHYHYSVVEVNKLMASARTLPHRAVLGFLYYQGPRVGEMCDLKMADLDMGRHEVRLYAKKNKKERLIPLMPALIPTLQDWLTMRETKAVPILQEQGLEVPENVFLNQEGRQFNKDSVEGLIDRAAARAGFTGRTLAESHPHTLRHTCANHLIHVHGWDIATVAYFLGDTVNTIERYYAHTGVEDCRRNMLRGMQR